MRKLTLQLSNKDMMIRALRNEISELTLTNRRHQNTLDQFSTDLFDVSPPPNMAERFCVGNVFGKSIRLRVLLLCVRPNGCQVWVASALHRWRVRTASTVHSAHLVPLYLHLSLFSVAAQLSTRPCHPLDLSLAAALSLPPRRPCSSRTRATPWARATAPRRSRCCWASTATSGWPPRRTRHVPTVVAKQRCVTDMDWMVDCMRHLRAFLVCMPSFPSAGPGTRPDGMLLLMHATPACAVCLHAASFLCCRRCWRLSSPTCRLIGNLNAQRVNAVSELML